MRLLCNKCGRKAIPPQRLRGQGELMCRRHLFIRQTVSIDETVFLLSGQTHKTYRLIPLHKAHNHITANQDLKNESAEGK